MQELYVSTLMPLSSSHPPEPNLTAQPKWRQIVSGRAEALGGWTEAHGTALLVLLLAIWLFGTVWQARVKPLWHDELFTFYIAQAPNLHVLWHELSHLDFNPPLIYLLVRGCDHLFGANELTARLPSIVIFLLGLICSYTWVRRRVGAIWGLVCVLALITNTHGYATEARPYALLLGFLLLLLLALDFADDLIDHAPAPRSRRRVAVLLLLFVCAAGAMLSHIVAMPLLLLLLASKMFADRRTGQDWQVLTALALPLLLCVVCRPMWNGHAISLFPPEFVPTPLTIMDFYSAIGEKLAMLFVPCVLGIIALFGMQAFRSRDAWPVRPAEGLFLLGMLLFPVALILNFMRNHAAFFLRYGFMASLALALLIPVLLAWLTAGRKAPAMLALLILAAGSIRLEQYVFHALHPSAWEVQNGPTSFPWEIEAISPNLPLVIDSGLGFVEMDHREPTAFLRNTYFLRDDDAAAKFAHATIFNGMADEKREFGFRANVENYTDFVAQHPCFVVFGDYHYPENWLLRKLMADGATLTLVASLPQTEYYAQDVWQVRTASAAPGSCPSR